MLMLLSNKGEVMNKKVLIVALCLILALAALAFRSFESKDRNSILSKEKLQNLKLPSEKGDYIDIKLYFDGSKDNKDVKIAKEERLVNKEELVGEIIMQELIKGPAVVSESKSILPKETRLLSFSIKEGIAYVNLSSVAEVTMSPEQEKTTLTCIATSLTQLPSIQQIMITVENKNIESLGGNYNISKPFSKQEIDGMRKR